MQQQQVQPGYVMGMQQKDRGMINQVARCRWDRPSLLPTCRRVHVPYVLLMSAKATCVRADVRTGHRHGARLSG